MSRRGRGIVSALLLAIAVAFFVPVFANASAGFTAYGYEYGPQIQLVLEYLPIMLAALALAVLAAPLFTR